MVMVMMVHPLCTTHRVPQRDERVIAFAKKGGKGGKGKDSDDEDDAPKGKTAKGKGGKGDDNGDASKIDVAKVTKEAKTDAVISRGWCLLACMTHPQHKHPLTRCLAHSGGPHEEGHGCAG